MLNSEPKSLPLHRLAQASRVARVRPRGHKSMFARWCNGNAAGPS